MQTELLEPMETRLRGEMGKTETRLRDDFGSRLDHLKVEIHSITNDVIGPFIKMADVRRRELVERLDRLEVQVERNRDKINRILTSVIMQERRLMEVYDDVTAIRQRLNSLERQLSGQVTYDIAQAEWVVAEERSVYEMICDL